MHTAPLALVLAALFAGDWPTFLGPTRDGQSTETGLRTEFGEDGPPLLWSVERGEGYASPVVQGGRLVFTHREGGKVHVDCLDAKSGERLWRFSRDTDFRSRYIGNSGPRATPVIDGEHVFVHRPDGKLYALALEDGEVLWERDLNEEMEIGEDYFGVVSSPLVHGEVLIQNVGAPGGPSVAAFDKKTGELAWGAGEEWGPSCASPVLATIGGKERLLVVAGGDSRPPTGGLMVIDPTDGEVEYSYPFRSRTYESVNASSPVVADDVVFLTASYNTGSAGIGIDEEGKYTELWTSRSIGIQFSNPVVLDGRVWVIDGRSDRAGAIVSVDPKTGKELTRDDLDWEETTVYRGEEKEVSMSVGEGSLLVVDGKLLCLGDNGHLLWLETSEEGVEVISRSWLFRANESWTPPVLSNGLLYVCQNNKERFGADPAPARLLCFDLRAD